MALGAGSVTPLQMAMEPDPWQERLLRDQARHIGTMASRQAGKSQTVGVKILHHAKVVRRAMVVIGSPSQRQSAELLAKAIECHYLNVGGDEEIASFASWQGDQRRTVAPASALDFLSDLTEKATKREAAGEYDADVEAQSKLELRLTNRSRIVAVPGRSGATVRGYSSLTMLVVDEAAFAPVEFFQATFPMLAVSGGQVILLSTPHAKIGPFYDIMQTEDAAAATPDWDDGKPAREQEDAWRKYVVPWTDCPRITPAFIEAERRRYGDHYVAREYECKFMEGQLMAFTHAEIAAMDDDSVDEWVL